MPYMLGDAHLLPELVAGPGRLGPGQHQHVLPRGPPDCYNTQEPPSVVRNISSLSLAACGKRLSCAPLRMPGKVCQSGPEFVRCLVDYHCPGFTQKAVKPRPALGAVCRQELSKQKRPRADPRPPARRCSTCAGNWHYPDVFFPAEYNKILAGSFIPSARVGTSAQLWPESIRPAICSPLAPVVLKI